MRIYLSSPGYTGTCNPPASSPKYYVLPAFGILCVYACVLEPVMCKSEVDIRCHPGSISTLPVKTWNSPSARLLTRKPQEPYLEVEELFPWDWDPNSGSHTYTASTETTKALLVF